MILYVYFKIEPTVRKFVFNSAVFYCIKAYFWESKKRKQFNLTDMINVYFQVIFGGLVEKSWVIKTNI